MAIKWCHNAKTGNIFSYTVNGDWTDFPKGELIVYDDYLTTDINSKKEALKWAEEYGDCAKCKSSRPVENGGCLFCGGEVVFHPVDCD